MRRTKFGAAARRRPVQPNMRNVAPGCLFNDWNTGRECGLGFLVHGVK